MTLSYLVICLNTITVVLYLYLKYLKYTLTVMDGLKNAYEKCVFIFRKGVLRMWD